MKSKTTSKLMLTTMWLIRSSKNFLVCLALLKHLSLLKNRFDHDLSDPEVLEKEYNVTMEDVWHSAPRMYPYPPPFAFIICTTFDPPIPKMIENTEIDLEVDILNTNSKWDIFHLEYHGKGESKQNYVFDWTTIEYIAKGKINAIYLKTQETRKLKKAKYNCAEDNSQRFTDCINDFYAFKLGCQLPWVRKTNSSSTYCKGQDKFSQFRNLSMSITKPELLHELRHNHHCFIPNCHQRSWTVANSKTLDTLDNENDTYIEFYLPSSSKVHLQNEIKLYTLANLFAEVGGYLGLLLGSSILSYIDTIYLWIKSSLSNFRRNGRLIQVRSAKFASPT